MGYLETLAISNKFSFPLRVRDSGILLYSRKDLQGCVQTEINLNYSKLVIYIKYAIVIIETLLFLSYNLNNIQRINCSQSDCFRILCHNLRIKRG